MLYQNMIKLSKISKILTAPFKAKRIYLDYASITPVDKRVLNFQSKISQKYPANPSSLYLEGVQAKKVLEGARADVAKVLNVHADEIIFTSGGTESNNLTIQGVLQAAKTLMKDTVPHVIATNIEHPSIRELLFQLKERGVCDVTFVPVDEEGIIDLKEFKKALRPETVLVSVILVNNEIGTIQPLHDIAKAVRHYKKELGRGGQNGQGASYPYIHTDACQAALFTNLRVPNLGIDLMTLDGSKIYGPRSSGILYIRRGIKIATQQIGGDQENGLRAGTEDVARAAGFGFALQLAVREKEKESVRLARLRDFMIQKIFSKLGGKIKINGAISPDKRVPNNLNICLPGIDAEFAVLRLDVRGVCVSSVTSCRSKKEDSSSYVVEALQDAAQISSDCSKSSLRITLGRFTTKRDVKKAVNKIIFVLTSMV